MRENVEGGVAKENRYCQCYKFLGLLFSASLLVPSHYVLPNIAIGYKKHLLIAATPYTSELKKNQNLKNNTKQKSWYHQGTETRIFKANIILYFI